MVGGAPATTTAPCPPPRSSSSPCPPLSASRPLPSCPDACCARSAARATSEKAWALARAEAGGAGVEVEGAASPLVSTLLLGPKLRDLILRVCGVW